MLRYHLKSLVAPCYKPIVYVPTATGVLSAIVSGFGVAIYWGLQQTCRVGAYALQIVVNYNCTLNTQDGCHVELSYPSHHFKRSDEYQFPSGVCANRQSYLDFKDNVIQYNNSLSFTDDEWNFLKWVITLGILVPTGIAILAVKLIEWKHAKAEVQYQQVEHHVDKNQKGSPAIETIDFEEPAQTFSICKKVSNFFGSLFSRSHFEPLIMDLDEKNNMASSVEYSNKHPF